MSEIEPKIALITGASSGIGEQIARQLYALGHYVILASRNLPKLEVLANELGEHAIAIELDVNSDESVNSLFSRLPAGWNEIDVLINNAGHDRGGRQRYDKGNPQQWMDIIETNVNGVIRMCSLISKSMIERNSGDIINIGSTSGLEPVPGTAVYSASKYAIHGLTQTLRLELENTRVRVMEINPGLVRTAFAANRFDDAEKGESFYDDFGKWLNPEDVANTVIFALQQPAHVVISQLVIVPKPITETDKNVT